MTERYYATRNDEKVPVVIDWEGDRMTPEEFPGQALSAARRRAAHLNGSHGSRRNPRCDTCAEEVLHD